MTVELMALKRRSFCKCGFPALDESITVGVNYRLDLSTRRGGFLYICGGCGGRFPNVEVVNASQVLNPDRPMMPLPFALFDSSLAL